MGETHSDPTSRDVFCRANLDKEILGLKIEYSLGLHVCMISAFRSKISQRSQRYSTISQHDSLTLKGFF